MIPRMGFGDNFFDAGGLGMYPIAICGFLLMVSAVLLVLRPEPRYLALVVSTMLMTLGSGVLSSFTGLANLLRYVVTIPAGQRVEIAIIGTAGMLNCMIFTLIFVQTSFWLLAIAALRAWRARAPMVVSTEKGPPAG